MECVFLWWPWSFRQPKIQLTTALLHIFPTSSEKEHLGKVGLRDFEIIKVCHLMLLSFGGPRAWSQLLLATEGRRDQEQKPRGCSTSSVPLTTGSSECRSPAGLRRAAALLPSPLSLLFHCQLLIVTPFQVFTSWSFTSCKRKILIHICWLWP